MTSADPAIPPFDRWAKAAIAIAMLLVMFVGSYQALRAGPYHVRDEQAHVGYVMSLSRFRLPSLDTPTEVPPTAPALEERLDETGDRAKGQLTPYHKVWVANHPPGAYLPAMPGVWLGRAIGSGNMVMLSLRLSNVAGLAAAVLMTAFLAREVTRRNAAAVFAAAATASVPYFLYITSWGMTDGVTLALTTGVVWAAIRALRRGFDRNSTLVLAAFSVGCGITRLTAVSTAAVVVATALVVHAWRRRTVPWRPALTVGLSVLVLTGWFWVLNVIRYGDPAAGSELYERFNRDETGSLWETITTRRLWTLISSAILEHNRDWAPEFRNAYKPLTIAILVLAAAGLVMLFDRLLPVAWDRWRRLPLIGSFGADRAATPAGAIDERDRRDRVVEPGALLILLAAFVATVLLVGNHVKAGGNPFGRYAMLVVPIVATFVGATLTVLRRPVVAGGAALAMLTVYVSHSHEYWSRFPKTMEYRFAAAANSPLRRPVGPTWAQHLLLDTAGLVAVALVVVTAVAVHRATRAHGEGASARGGRSDSVDDHD